MFLYYLATFLTILKLSYICDTMETFIDVYLKSNGEKASVIYKKLINLGLKPTIGEHDFVYDWKKIVDIEEELKLIENIQSALNEDKVTLKFKTIR